MHWEGLNIPDHVIWDEETLSSTYGQFAFFPLEQGLARTLGNGLRRVLLSALKGATVTTLRIEGVLHEFGFRLAEVNRKCCHGQFCKVTIASRINRVVHWFPV